MSDVIQKIISGNVRNEGSVVVGVNNLGQASRIIPPTSPSGIGYIGVDVNVLESGLTNSFNNYSDSGVYSAVFAGISHLHTGTYAATSHTHSGTYPDLVYIHNHSGVYADVDHNHSGIYWDDLTVPANSLRLGSTIADYTQYYGGLYLPAFAAGGTSDQAFFATQLPHDYKQGTHLYPHVHWSPGPSGTGYNNQGVAWIVDISWANISGSMPFPISYSGIDSWGTLGNYTHRMVACVCSGLDYMDGTGKTISSMIIGRISRQNDRADDNYGAPAYLMEIDFHYQKDWLGSNTISAK